tara:strand:- start:3559 stop:4371 length:813 start_codon:yes stop_codon:yes gene_type:complete
MKKLYSFDIERKVEKQVPHVKKTKDGPIETTKKVTKKIKNKVAFLKPSVSDLEDADFFYGQKYNEFINAGFLTKAMLAKKMGDLGGLTSEKAQKVMNELVAENVEAARKIEFFAGAKNLDEEQKKELKEAKESFTSTGKTIQTIENDLRSQFNQTADAKAEQKLIEWLVLHFSFYEDEVEGEEKKKSWFSLFDGENYEEKRQFLVAVQEDINDISESTLLKAKKIFDSSYQTLIRVASLWYNRIAEDQESMDKALKDLFEDDGEEPLQDS